MQWYYSYAGQQIGPVSESDMRSLAQAGTIQPETLVWKSGLPNWVPASQAAELELTFSGAPPPLAPMVSGGMAGPAVPETPVSNTGPFVASILTTVMCLPLGIPGIFYAAKIGSRNAKGDFQGAREASRWAYIWSCISLGVSVVMVPVVGLMAAMAIPAFNRVRMQSRQTALVMDGRALGIAAQQYFLTTGKNKVTFGYEPMTGAISGDLTPWVTMIGKNYTVHDNTIESGADEAFSLSFPGAFGGQAVSFTDEGKTEADPAQFYRTR